MPKISIQDDATGKTHSVGVTKPLLYWSMIYANKSHNDIQSASELKTYLNWRTSLADYIFDLSQQDLKINPCVSELESSYRANISFEIGMTMTNIVAKNLYGIRHLYHLKKNKYHVGAPNKTSVDLLGELNGQYYAFEAKATIDNYWYGKTRALQQLASLNTVNKHPPKKYASLFRCKNSIIQGRMIDPEDGMEDILLEDSFFYSHYGLLNYLQDETLLDNFGAVRYIRFDKGLFGLLSSPLSLEKNYVEQCLLDERSIRPATIEGEKYQYHIFNDGTFIAFILHNDNT